VGLTGLTTVTVPPGQYTIQVTQTLLVAGTSGTAVVNVVYNDLLGVAKTRAVGSGLAVAGVAGDEATASLTFQTSGVGGISFTITGVVTPGALSFSSAINLTANY